MNKEFKGGIKLKLENGKYIVKLPNGTRTFFNLNAALLFIRALALK